MVRRGGDQVGRISAKRTIPDPALVLIQCRVEHKRLGLLVGPWRPHVYFPDLGSVVGATRGQPLAIGRQQDTRDIVVVCAKLRDRHGLGPLVCW